jgi:hypothetical protein
VARARKDLHDLVARIDDANHPSEIDADLRKYQCIRIAGFVEQALLSSCRALCPRESFARGESFTMSWLERAPNPRADEIARIVRRFDTAWADEFEDFLSEYERGNRINALLGIRNQVAHGKDQGVSKVSAEGYLEVASEIVDWLLERFDPLPEA